MDFPDWLSPTIRKTVKEDMVPKIMSREHTNLTTSLNVKGGGQLNLFTLSLYVQAFSRVGRLQLSPSAHAEEALGKLDTAAASLLSHAAFTGVDGDKTFRIHPFLLYHVGRACRLSRSFKGPQT